MRRNSMLTTPKNGHKNSDKRHVFSQILTGDPRLQTGPRAVENIHTLGEPSEGTVFLVKIYSGLDTPGTELMTVSCVNASTGLEAEIRFDEKFPISIRFRNQSDSERVNYAREQIGRAGGFDWLLNAFRSCFPKISI